MQKISEYQKALETFDIEDLNMYEKIQFDVMTCTMSKYEALNRIVEEATLEELNPVLSEIAEENNKF